ncbi:aldose 1-epimerase family protein [Aerococcaceae bacterium DSM 111022]|nr:aldose 1-epimerase family protein [Aerococcaceae bacterium DSM 111022]
MVTISNDHLVVEISLEGAELTSIKDAETGHEFLWQGDPAFWGRHAPVLFPNVGRVKGDRYYFDDEEYEISQHGFARDMTFTEQIVTANSATFNLKSNALTLEKYPFDFSFQITYILHENQITVSYEILNPGDKVLYYSVGGHPAFNVSQTKDSKGHDEFDQVYFKFSPEGQYLHIPLTKDGLVRLDAAKYQSVTKEALTHKSFKNDALIYQIGKQTEVSLIDEAADTEILVRSSRMPFVGIWSPYPKRAGFVCIEPWAGLADDENTDGDYATKYGSQSLGPNEIRTHDYTIDFIKR